MRSALDGLLDVAGPAAARLKQLLMSASQTSWPRWNRQALAEHLHGYGLAYASGSLVMVAAALGAYLLLSSPDETGAGTSASTSARKTAAPVVLPDEPNSPTQRLIEMPPEQWVQRLETEAAKVRAQSQQVAATANATRVLDVDAFRAAPSVAQQVAQNNRVSADMLEGFKKLEAMAQAAAQPAAPIQHDMERMEERYANAVATRLNAARERVVISSSTLPNGQFNCSFSAGVGTGLATVSGQGATLDAACAAALAAPEDKIVRLATVPVEKAVPATGR